MNILRKTAIILALTVFTMVTAVSSYASEGEATLTLTEQNLLWPVLYRLLDSTLSTT